MLDTDTLSSFLIELFEFYCSLSHRPGLPHSESRTGKLMNMSFTKMQADYSNYNSNFALSKREKEIRAFLKISRLAPQVQMQKSQQ